MPTTKRFCHHKINDQKINLSIALHAKGFSLIELLAVVLVLAILSTIALTAFDGVDDEAALELTKAEMTELAKAVRRFKQDTGHFPGEAIGPPDEIADEKKLALLHYCQDADDTQVSGTGISYDVNCKKLDKDTGIFWRGPYMATDGFVKDASGTLVEDNSYQDAWQNDYRLADVGSDDIRIWSAGPDGEFGLGFTDDCKSSTATDDLGKDDLILCLKR